MKKIIIISLLFTFNTFAQYENNIFIVPSAFRLNQLSSAGYSSINGSAANITALNPAAISIFNEISAGDSYQFESNLNPAWIDDIGTKRINNLLLQSAGIVLPLDTFCIAVGMHQLYSSNLDVGAIPITTMEEPEGTSEDFTPEIKTDITSFSAAAAFSTNDLISDVAVSAGIKLGYNIINYSEKVNMYHAEVVLNAFNIGAGILFGTEKMKIGLSYESGFDETKVYEIKSSPLVQSDSIVFYRLNLTARCKVPAVFSAGLFYEWSALFSSTTNVNYIFWNSVDRGNNEPQLSASLIYRLNNFLSPSAGIIYASKTYDKSLMLNVDDKMNALYITFGLKAQLLNFYADVSFADSH